MVEASPSFSALVQGFFVDYLRQQRALSPHTIAAYRDTFRLLLLFAQKHIGKAPHQLSLSDIDATFVLAFLDHLERDRHCSGRSRNARLSAIRSFLKYAAHQDLTALASIERCLAIPQKRHDKPLLGFMTRVEMEAVIAAPDTRTWAGRRDHALFTLLYNTGARVSEAVDLKVADIVLDVAPTVHLFGKGRKHRSVPLWKTTAATVRQWRRHLPDAVPDAHLFPRSAVAAAAYRSASRLEDERLGRHHDFTNKPGVVHSEVMLPEGAPERLRDRETLWNEVEAAEKRKDAGSAASRQSPYRTRLRLLAPRPGREGRRTGP